MLKFKFCLYGLCYTDAGDLSAHIQMNNQSVYQGKLITTHVAPMPDLFFDRSQPLAEFAVDLAPQESPFEMPVSIEISGADALCGAVVEDLLVAFPYIGPDDLAPDPPYHYGVPYAPFESQAKYMPRLDGGDLTAYTTPTPELNGPWKYPVKSGSKIEWTYKFFYLEPDLVAALTTKTI